jgi:hypothetical protein
MEHQHLDALGRRFRTQVCAKQEAVLKASPTEPGKATLKLQSLRTLRARSRLGNWVRAEIATLHIAVLLKHASVHIKVGEKLAARYDGRALDYATLKQDRSSELAIPESEMLKLAMPDHYESMEHTVHKIGALIIDAIHYVIDDVLGRPDNCLSSLSAGILSRRPLSSTKHEAAFLSLNQIEQLVPTVQIRVRHWDKVVNQGFRALRRFAIGRSRRYENRFW